MNVVTIVQARMSSTRFPGKIMKEVLGKPLIAYELERLKRSALTRSLVLATTGNPQDLQVIEVSQRLGISSFRGSEEDVLDRYLHAAEEFQADVIVRISGDCPLIDPAVVDQAIRLFLEHEPSYDYVSNTIVRTYPRGMDVEVFSYSALKEAFRNAEKSYEREHVTPFIWQKPDKFRLGMQMQPCDESFYRLTVDTEEDFLLIKRIIEKIYPENPAFNKEQLILLLEKHPDWAAINSHVQQKVL